MHLISGLLVVGGVVAFPDYDAPVTAVPAPRPRQGEGVTCTVPLISHAELNDYNLVRWTYALVWVSYSSFVLHWPNDAPTHLPTHVRTQHARTHTHTHTHAHMHTLSHTHIPPTMIYPKGCARAMGWGSNSLQRWRTWRKLGFNCTRVQRERCRSAV